MAITPDGPRGPVYEISPGLIYLASKTGKPVMTIRVDYERYWELRSWDKFRIPKPFSKVHIRFQEPFVIEGGDGARVEEQCKRLQALLG